MNAAEVSSLTWPFPQFMKCMCGQRFWSSYVLREVRYVSSTLED